MPCLQRCASFPPPPPLSPARLTTRGGAVSSACAFACGRDGALTSSRKSSRNVDFTLSISRRATSVDSRASRRSSSRPSCTTRPTEDFRDVADWDFGNVPWRPRRRPSRHQLDKRQRDSHASHPHWVPETLRECPPKRFLPSSVVTVRPMLVAAISMSLTTFCLFRRVVAIGRRFSDFAGRFRNLLSRGSLCA